MPKLYEYLGIMIFFYSNEHEPVHVHGRYGQYESKIEIHLRDGKIQSINLLRVPGKKSLPSKQSKQFKKLVTIFAEEIVQSWINYFVYNKKIISKKIDGNIS